MKKSLIVLLSLFSLSIQAKTLDDYGKMTVAEFAEYLTKKNTEKDVLDEFYPVLIDEYGDNKMSEKMFDTLLTYRSQETVDMCNNIDAQPRKQREYLKKDCNTKISDKVIKPMEEIFKKLGLLH